MYRELYASALAEVPCVETPGLAEASLKLGKLGVSVGSSLNRQSLLDQGFMILYHCLRSSYLRARCERHRHHECAAEDAAVGCSAADGAWLSPDRRTPSGWACARPPAPNPPFRSAAWLGPVYSDKRFYLLQHWTMEPAC